MYDEIVNLLRRCGKQKCKNCEYEYVLGCVTKLNEKAADAIEEMSSYVRQIEELRKDGYYLQKTKMMTCGNATMTMPLPEPPKKEHDG